MAITIKVEPQVFQSGYNEVMVVLDSTNKSESKFQYIIDVNINGVFSSRLKVQSNPQGYGVVNLGRHLESYITSSLDLADKEIFKKIEDSYTKYDVTLSEEYVFNTSFISVTDNGGFCQYNYATSHNFVDEDFVTVSGSSVPAYDGIQEVASVPSATAIVTTEVYSATATGNTVLSNGTVTVVADPATFTGDKYITNNVNKWVDVPNWNATDYVIDSANVGNFLTNLPSTFYTELEDRVTMNIYNSITDEAKHLQVTNSQGNTFFYDNNFPTTAATTKFLSVGVGAFDVLNAPLSGTLVSSSSAIIDGNTTFYTVKLLDSLLNVSSEEYRFNIVRGCDVYEGYRFMYLNKGGSFSTFNFDLASSKTTSVNKKNYKKNYGTYDSVGNTYGWESSDRGETRIDTDIKEIYTVTSNYVKEDYGNTIEDLIESPEVYHLADNNLTFDTPQTILVTSIDAGFFQIRTGAAHGLNVGDVVQLAGFADASFNQEFKVLSITGATFATLEKPLTVLPFVGGAETIAKQIFDSDGTLRSVDILTNSVKIKKRNTDKTINYTLSFKYSNKNTVQR